MFADPNELNMMSQQIAVKNGAEMQIEGVWVRAIRDVTVADMTPISAEGIGSPTFRQYFEIIK